MLCIHTVSHVGCCETSPLRTPLGLRHINVGMSNVLSDGVLLEEVHAFQRCPW